MREIKFRGLDHEGKWHYGNLYKDEISAKIEVFPVNPETVGQYTGLPDYDGTAIYEGDILGEPHHGEEVTVEWKCGRFIAKFENGNEVALANIARYCRVVGNIHDERPVEG